MTIPDAPSEPFYERQAPVVFAEQYIEGAPPPAGVTVENGVATFPVVPFAPPAEVAPGWWVVTTEDGAHALLSPEDFAARYAPAHGPQHLTPALRAALAARGQNLTNADHAPEASTT
jgi:hypothetical protein